MTNLIERIDNLINERSLLKHPFYVLWSEGKLTKESLNGYSQEYFQLVKAVPKFIETIIENNPNGSNSELGYIKDEEIEHIEPWINFAHALGVEKEKLNSYAGLKKTQTSIEILQSLMNSIESGAAAMYALEKDVPKVSNSKLVGLREFYGIKDHKTIEYFKLHTEADIRHANTWRKLLNQISEDKSDELFEVAQKSVEAQNLLLDACFEQYCKN
jgi:pyrroloquinoline-quinone synthase